ncbi:DUF2188 domain-containing protein [Nitratireductor luteus]|uniref:DUF2188 domain-containing protein n=1 Tax=Nitratireductor luteus TaxID=2976980 RepID=UPI00223F6D16|nr:DUF2188 domain-containing protein [Nitratireductor luteus]
MAKVTYEVVEHDEGWAYKVGDVYSETYKTREEARRAAEHAAAEQEQPGSDEDIEYQDSKGTWRQEHAEGDDRPQTDVEDPE